MIGVKIFNQFRTVSKVTEPQFESTLDHSLESII